MKKLFLIFSLITFFKIWPLLSSNENDTAESEIRYNKDKIYKWAIVGLVRPRDTSMDRRDNFVSRNQRIANKLRPYAKNHDITIIYFSEDFKFLQNNLHRWTKTFKNVAKVKIIDTSSNGFLDTSVPASSNNQRRYGYHYM